MITKAWDFITLKDWRDKREAIRRRANYEAIKAMIVQRHFQGFGGHVLSKREFDLKDLESFKPPMYQIAITSKNEPVIFWRKDLMTEEIGPPQKSGA